MDAARLLQRHRRLIEVGFWCAYLGINAIVASLSVITEYRRIGRPLMTWEPFCWEFSSALMTGLLVFAVAQLNRAVPIRADSWLRPLGIHLLATVPFSLLHVGGMVALRKLVYAVLESSYDFGALASELLYEFRKDFVTYWFILGVLYLWRYLRLTRRAEPAEGETHTAPIKRLVARKHGREFPINAADIDWIESSGNYANLHIDRGVFPVRISMTELERRLDPEGFARVHRAHIVNLDRIREIRPTDAGDFTVLMRDGAELRFSRRYRAALKNRFDI